MLVGRGVLRNPWIFAQAVAAAAGRPVSAATMADRGRFLLEYIDLLLDEGVSEPEGFRHSATGYGSGHLSRDRAADLPARGHERWVVNKLRALCAWYTRGLEGGSHLRVAVNHANSIPALRETISQFFF